MVSRRQFISLAIPVILPQMAWARNDPLGPPTPYFAPRKAWVSQPALIRQQCPQWCWAASIAMIFARHGHPIDQQTIVTQTLGGLACQSAPNTLTIARDLSRTWVDNNGVTFSSIVTAAYDPANGITNLSNQAMLDELTYDRPLLYCNRHHAMVLVVVDYLETQMGPNIRAGAVLDPWPYSPGYHYLSPQEFIPAHIGGDMTFLAAVHVQ